MEGDIIITRVGNKKNKKVNPTGAGVLDPNTQYFPIKCIDCKCEFSAVKSIIKPGHATEEIVCPNKSCKSDVLIILYYNGTYHNYRTGQICILI